MACALRVSNNTASYQWNFHSANKRGVESSRTCLPEANLAPNPPSPHHFGDDNSTKKSICAGHTSQNFCCPPFSKACPSAINLYLRVPCAPWSSQFLSVPPLMPRHVSTDGSLEGWQWVRRILYWCSAGALAVHGPPGTLCANRVQARP